MLTQPEGQTHHPTHGTTAAPAQPPPGGPSPPWPVIPEASLAPGSGAIASGPTRWKSKNPCWYRKIQGADHYDREFSRSQ